jgi:hypothetical protein
LCIDCASAKTVHYLSGVNILHVKMLCCCKCGSFQLCSTPSSNQTPSRSILDAEAVWSRPICSRLLQVTHFRVHQQLWPPDERAILSGLQHQRVYRTGGSRPRTVASGARLNLTCRAPAALLSLAPRCAPAFAGGTLDTVPSIIIAQLHRSALTRGGLTLKTLIARLSDDYRKHQE